MLVHSSLSRSRFAFLLVGLIPAATIWAQSASNQTTPSQTTPSQTTPSQTTPNQTRPGQTNPTQQVPARQVTNPGMARSQPAQNRIASRPQPSVPQAPEWYPLPPELAKYTNEILAYWEWRSNKIARYRCKFKRWEYDPVRIRDPRVFSTYAEGVIKYEAPDKGLFRVEKTSQRVLPIAPGKKPEFEVLSPDLNEYWVCDGTAIFQFHGLKKQVIQRNLPPEMRGKQISHGPLPFLFNAKAEDIQKRYWVRALAPPPTPKTYHLVAVPKTREDAADFLRVEIVIAAEEDCLPEAIILYYRNGGKTTFGFENREENWTTLVENLNIFHREFYEPKTPEGWTKIVEQPTQAPTQAPLLQTQQPGGRTVR